MKPSATLDAEWNFRPATPRDWPDLARLWLGPEPSSLNHDHFVHLLHQDRELAEGYWVATHQDQIMSVLLAIPRPGAVATVWPIKVAGDVTPEVARPAALRLWAALRAGLMNRQIRFFQCLVAPPALADQEWMAYLGFRHLTQLLTMKTSSTEHSVIIMPDHLHLDPVAPALLDEFRQTLVQTYHDSLDTPEMDQYQRPEDVLAGFAHPAHWSWLVRNTEGKHIGVLVLTFEQPCGQINYLGLIPSARKQGLGTVLVHRALCQFAQNHIHHVEVRLDVRNLPAEKLYRKCGFEVLQHDELFVST